MKYTWIMNLGTITQFDGDKYQIVENKYIMDKTTGQMMLITNIHHEVDKYLDRSDKYIFITETF